MSDRAIEILEADPSLPAHATAIVRLLDAYARDPMGGGVGLSEAVKARLPAELARRESIRVVLALADREPAGLIVAIEGFSTFAGRPLLNIHDVIVAPDYRGRGLSTRLLQKVEAIARDLGCCKLTLEVLAGNAVAQAAYRSAGFTAYELDPAMGRAQFWHKPLE